MIITHKKHLKSHSLYFFTLHTIQTPSNPWQTSAKRYPNCPYRKLSAISAKEFYYHKFALQYLEVENHRYVPAMWILPQDSLRESLTCAFAFFICSAIFIFALDFGSPRLSFFYPFFVCLRLN